MTDPIYHQENAAVISREVIPYHYLVVTGDLLLILR